MVSNGIPQDVEERLAAYLEVKQATHEPKPDTISATRFECSMFEQYRAELNKDYSELNQTDLAGWVSKRRAELSNSTLVIKWSQVRQYLRWVLTGGVDGGRLTGNYPDPLDTIRVSFGEKPDHSKVRISPQEYEAILEQMPKLWHKVYLALLWDTGARRIEVNNLRLKDINAGDLAYSITVKTAKVKGSRNRHRTVYLQDSVGLLRSYLNSRVDDPDAWLFPATRVASKSVELDAFPKMLRRIVVRLKKEGVIEKDKRLTCHAFRHNRAAVLKNSTKWSSDKLNLWFGWSKASNMANMYGSTTEDELARAHARDVLGLPQESEEDDFELNCPYCDRQLGAGHKLCPYCGHALSMTYASEVEEARKEEDVVEQAKRELLDELLKDSPHLMEQYVSELRESQSA